MKFIKCRVCGGWEEFPNAGRYRLSPMSPHLVASVGEIVILAKSMDEPGTCPGSEKLGTVFDPDWKFKEVAHGN